MSQGVRISDFESGWRKFDRLVQAMLAFFVALLLVTVVPAVGFMSFIQLVMEFFK